MDTDTARKILEATPAELNRRAERIRELEEDRNVRIAREAGLREQLRELEKEREGIHSCHDKCPRPLCVANRRIRELERTLLSTQIQNEDQLRRIRELEQMFSNLQAEAKLLLESLNKAASARDRVTAENKRLREAIEGAPCPMALLKPCACEDEKAGRAVLQGNLDRCWKRKALENTDGR